MDSKQLGHRFMEDYVCGMKVHAGVDKDSGLIHPWWSWTPTCTTSPLSAELCAGSLDEAAPGPATFAHDSKSWGRTCPKEANQRMVRMESPGKRPEWPPCRGDQRNEGVFGRLVGSSTAQTPVVKGFRMPALLVHLIHG